MNKEELLTFYDKYKQPGYSHFYKDDFERAIEEILVLHNLEKANLEAKVYTYEKIIANSNFKAINNKSVETLNKKIKELEQELEILKGE